MSSRFQRALSPTRTSLPIAAVSIALVGGCSPQASSQQPCSGGSVSCQSPCASSQQASGPLITVIAPGTSDSLTRTANALANDPKSVTASLHLSGTPTVDLETYDASGALTSHGIFNLNGSGRSHRAAQADAKTQAACLLETVQALGPRSARPDLIRALPKATQLASAGGSKGAAVLAFGLGISHIDQTPLAKVDLTDAAARTKVVSTLTNNNLLGTPTTVPVAFIDPGEAVPNAIVANNLATFAGNELCRAVSVTCSAPLVLQ